MKKADKNATPKQKAGLRRKKMGRPRKYSQLFPVYDSMLACQTATGFPIEVLKELRKSGSEAFAPHRVEFKTLIVDFFKKCDVLGLVAMVSKSRQPELLIDDEGKVGGRPAFDEFRAQREQIRLQKDKEQVMSKAQVRQDNNEAVAELIGTFERVFVNEMPPIQEGMRALEVRNMHQEAIDSCKEQLRRRFTEMEKDGETVKAAL